MPNANEILKSKLSTLSDEQKCKMTEMLFADTDRLVDATLENMARIATAQLERENERLEKLIRTK